MKKILFACSAAIALTGIVALSSCSSKDEVPSNVVVDQNGTKGVKPEFVISIPRTVIATRMTGDVTQKDGTVAQFRGLDNIRLISFAGTPTTSSVKLSDILRLSSISTLKNTPNMNYKVYADQFVPVGTKNFLFYAKAVDNTAETDITSMDDKFHFGFLKYTGLTDAEFNTPNDIVFSLEQINENGDRQAGDPVGQALVKFITDLANTTVGAPAVAPDNKWSTTTNATLAPLYKAFIGVTTGSSNSIAVILSKIYNGLKHVQSTDPAYELAKSLKAQIEAACTETPISGAPVKLNSTYAGYPANIGLPDGAVRVRWNVTGLTPNIFVDITANYNLGNKVPITNYVYPASLWYYTSSPLKASTEIESKEYETAGNWDGVINSVYNAATDEVQDNTQSVAMVNQANYGVGRMETKITMPAGTFYDGNGEEVEVGTGYTLKGFLLGGQCSAGFDFAAKGDENYTIYDREMASSSIIAKPNTTTGTANQTLALQTKSNQVIYCALELVNGGEEFMGADGLIPAGGTFYLTAKLDPTTASNYELGTLDKIVMQDHVTKLTITIKNGATTVDRDKDGNPDVYVKDGDGKPTGVDKDGDGVVDPYDIDGDGNDDTFITDPDHGGPGWDTDGDGEVDIPVTPDKDGNYPNQPNVNEGLGNATNGLPNLNSPGIELGTSVNLEWQQGLILNPEI
ncbi:MAG: hypothetical protein K5945_08635 [Bacteroidaceae bacterium]|nr:hypothetical protein [Bacteroidaceae bacterium]